MNNQFLISSDHHANWDTLEKLFMKAAELEIPFVINGDIIGDYQFSEFSQALGILYPQDILNYELKRSLSKSEKHLDEKEIQELYNKIFILKKNDILRHQNYLKKLYNLYVEVSARTLAKFIDKYKVKTYFLLGNHEPIFFHDLVLKFLVNKNLYVDMNKSKGILDIDTIKVCAISNTNAIMPYLYSIYNKEELYMNFLHLFVEQRPTLICDDKDFISSIRNDSSYKEDFDWKRIVCSKTETNLLEQDGLDIFISHGQIGTGMWNDGKFASQVVTLTSAAALALHAKLCIDGHLHTNYEMTNAVNKKCIRAIGNKAYIISKDNNQIKYDLISVDAPYNHRGSLIFDDLEEVKKKVFGSNQE